MGANSFSDEYVDYICLIQLGFAIYDGRWR